MSVTRSQSATLATRLRTRWVDSKAVHDSPNIVQQGLWNRLPMIKLQIGEGPRRLDHVGECVLVGRNGRILIAHGPAIDVADGRWHTVTCTKSYDRPGWTAARVDVDGVPGATYYSTGPIGDLVSSSPVTVGGRTSVASRDSLDGWMAALAYAHS